jgi:hypothetical protein
LLFDTFPAHGVRYVSINDDYDSFADDAGRKKLLVLFKNLVNQIYAADVRKKMRSVIDMKFQRGEFVGVPPYGYALSADKKYLEISPDATAIVRRIFDMRLNGLGIYAISDRLTRDGIPTPKRRRAWDASTIGKILRNETYLGILIQNKRRPDGVLPPEQWIVHENAHPAIVARDVFDEVQRVRQAINSKLNVKPRKPLPENRYAGKIFCSVCVKRATVFNCGSLTGNLRYYGCRDCHREIKIRTGQTATRKTPSSALDAALSATLRKQMETLVNFERIAEELAASDTLRSKTDELRREKSRLEKAGSEADRMLTTAYTHHLEGLLDFKEYELVRAKVEQDKLETIARLVKAESELRRHDVHTARENAWLKEFGAFRDFETPTKALIQALVKAIHITPIDNDIQIELNYMDAFDELCALKRESGANAND